MPTPYLLVYAQALSADVAGSFQQGMDDFARLGSVLLKVTPFCLCFSFSTTVLLKGAVPVASYDLTCWCCC